MGKSVFFCSQKQLYGRLKTRERFQLHFLPLIDKESTFDISSGKQNQWSKGKFCQNAKHLPHEINF